MPASNPSIKIALLLLLILLFPLLAPAANITVAGRVFTESGPLAGAKIYVYKMYQDIVPDKPFSTSGPTDVRGFYTFQLEPGEYYFTARGNDGGKIFFAYHGGNPVRVDMENIWVSLMANEEKQPVYLSGVPSLEGIVTYKGAPVPDANVAIYTPDVKKFKGLGFLAEKSIGFMKTAGKDGTFNFPLLPGKYVVIARKTNDGGEIRPLGKGELFCYAPLNPIEVKPDQAVRVEVPCYPKGDRLAFVNSPRIKTNDYLTLDKAGERSKYGIKGKVVDEQGAPLQGIYVIAYRADDPAKASGEPQSLAVTDAEGNYFIRLEIDGNYGLVARDTLGGAPEFKDITGIYNQGEDPWQGVLFKTGELIENVNISITLTKKDRKMLFE